MISKLLLNSIRYYSIASIPLYSRIPEATGYASRKFTSKENNKNIVSERIVTGRAVLLEYIQHSPGYPGDAGNPRQAGRGRAEAERGRSRAAIRFRGGI